MLNSLILFICCLLPKRHKAPVASLSFLLCCYWSYICLLEGQTTGRVRGRQPRTLGAPEFGILACSKADKCNGVVPLQSFLE